MKKIILGICLLAAIGSCKKSSNDVTCEVSVTGIAASFKLTKVVSYFPSPLPDQDQTSSYLTDPCEANGVYQLKSDKSVVYTEGTGCGGSGTGTWDVVNGKMSVDAGVVFLTDLSVTGWDCGTLTLSQDLGSGVGVRYTFSKQ